VGGSLWSDADNAPDREKLRIDITASPRKNIYAGAKYINWLHSIFDPKIQDEDERTKFILAAYNAGPGHILDAMKLAGKYGYNPEVWDNNVEECFKRNQILNITTTPL